MKNKNYDVWFISDLHIAHKNILRHQPKRIEAMSLKDEDDIEKGLVGSLITEPEDPNNSNINQMIIDNI